MVAIREDGHAKGRYVHWDGYPSGVGLALLKMVERDGLERVTEVLTREHYGWSTVDAQGVIADEYAFMYPPTRFEAVPGYGVAFVNDTEQSDEWIDLDDDSDDWCEYAYVLTSEGLEVYEQGAGWKPLGTVAWDPSSVGKLQAMG